MSDEDLPAPAWTEYDDDQCAQALVALSGAVFEQKRRRRIDRARSFEQGLLSTIRSLSHELRRVQAQLAAARVTLRGLESNTEAPAYDADQATADVAFIRRLPGGFVIATN